MKAFIILALVAVAAADVSHVVKSGEAGADIISQSTDVRPDGFAFGFQTSNGISGQESGALKTIDKDQAAIVVEGENSYTSPEGQVIGLKYVADENGYQPQGAHLPTPPAPQEIPEYIIRSLEYIRTHPAKEDVYAKKA